MALLTIPAITKGAEATVTLTKSDLIALAPVVASSWFSASSNANIASVKVIYKSTAGNQKKSLFFDFSQTTPSSKVLFSTHARSTFAISKIIVQDFDQGTLVIQGSDIPSGLNINL